MNLYTLNSTTTSLILKGMGHPSPLPSGVFQRGRTCQNLKGEGHVSSKNHIMIHLGRGEVLIS